MFELNWKTVLKSSLTFWEDTTKFYSILLGDSVVVELSPYDLTRGRIIYRLKQNNPSKLHHLKKKNLDPSFLFKKL
jgi:hypothetical protein